jgi:hypothetical protein
VITTLEPETLTLENRVKAAVVESRNDLRADPSTTTMSVNELVHEPAYSVVENVNVNVAAWSVRARYTLVPEPRLYGLEPRFDATVCRVDGAGFALTVSVCALYCFDAAFRATVTTALGEVDAACDETVNEITPVVPSIALCALGPAPPSVSDAEVAMNPYCAGANRTVVVPEGTVDGAST